MTPETLTVATLCQAMRAAEDAARTKVDLKLRLHADGSGCIEDAHTLKNFHSFDNLPQLLGWVLANIGWKTNACSQGFHKLCIFGPAIPCQCDCHKPKGTAA